MVNQKGDQQLEIIARHYEVQYYMYINEPHASASDFLQHNRETATRYFEGLLQVWWLMLVDGDVEKGVVMLE